MLTGLVGHTVVTAGTKGTAMKHLFETPKIINAIRCTRDILTLKLDHFYTYFLFSVSGH